MLDYNTGRTVYSPWAQLAILLLLTGFGFLLGGIVSILIALSSLHVSFTEMRDAILNSTNANFLRIVQVVSTFFAMAVPAVIFARIVSNKPFRFLGYNHAISSKQILMVVVIAFFALIISGSLSMVNEMIPLSKSAEKYFKSLEDEYSKQVYAIANMKTVQDYLMSLLIIALLPAMFEEMLFRGSLQPIIINICRNAFAGILITSILFSALHGSYYGFLPRLALGIILGYIYYYSKNIWLNMLMHFLNNAVGVTQLYLISRKGSLTAQSMGDDTVPLLYGIIALIILFGVFRYFKKESNLVLSLKGTRKE